MRAIMVQGVNLWGDNWWKTAPMAQEHGLDLTLSHDDSGSNLIPGSFENIGHILHITPVHSAVQMSTWL